MVNIFLIIGLTALVMAVAGGLGYLVWLKTRPKKEFWNAKVYRLSEGVRASKNSKFELKDLVPYARDVLEKVDKKEGGPTEDTVPLRISSKVIKVSLDFSTAFSKFSDISTKPVIIK